ncbi:MAG: hypothetical protein L0Y37_07690 [Bacteroidales bacterium]|nr:hypothetical protein [Bacteroidales bacterium]
MKNVTLLFFLAFLFTSLQGQQDMFPPLKGYKQVSDYPVYTPDDLWDYINGAADAYLALGFIDLNITEYRKGKQSLKAEVYSFGDEATAFGIYSLERSPSYDFIKVGVQGYSEEGVVNFYKGRHYVKIMTHSGSKKATEAMINLAEMIAERIEGGNEFPALLKLFPADGLVANQETYIMEGVLGHDFLHDAYRASYEIESDRFEIYLFNSKNRDIISEMAKRLAGEAFNAGDESFKYVFEDGFNGLLFMALQGDKLLIISGLDREKSALADRYITMMLK